LSHELQETFDDASGQLAIGELDEAIVLYRKCVELDPTHFDSWHALSMVLLKTDHLKEALGASLQATSLQPNDLLAWTALSQIYVRLGDIPNAEAAKQNSTILSIGGKVSR
jgi:tetratricopeptide (TPR) repeat protein